MPKGATIELLPVLSPAPLPENGKRFHIWTIGCQMNEADSARVAAMLHEAGYRATESEADADIVVLNSCVVRQAAEDKVAGKLNSLIREKRARPEMKLVLTGCMVTNQQEKLKAQFPHVDLFFDPSDFESLRHFVPELDEMEDAEEAEDDAPADEDDWGADDDEYDDDDEDEDDEDDDLDERPDHPRHVLIEQLQAERPDLYAHFRQFMFIPIGVEDYLLVDREVGDE